MAIGTVTPTCATEQDRVLTSSQAFALYGKNVVRAHLTAKRWANPAHGVILMHNGPPSPAQRNWIALLACAPGSVLGGLSALTEDGLKGFEPDTPQIAQPMGAKPPSYRDVDPHW